MSDDSFDLQQERQRLSAEVARLRVERDTGVPVELLTSARTEEEARSLAEQALSWRGNAAPQAAPPPPAAANLPNQIGRDALPYMTAAEINAAVRRGQFEGIGAGVPAPRKTGERNGRTL